MPTLKTFTADLTPGNIGGGRRATGADFGAGVGAGLQDLGATSAKVAEQVLQDTEAQDVRNIQIKTAQLRAQVGDALDNAVKTGGDLTAVQEQFQNQLSDIQAGTTTRAGLQASQLYGSSATTEIGGAVRAAISKRAGVQAQNDANTWAATQGALLAQNPNGLKQAESEADAFVQTFNEVPPEFREKMRLGLRERLNIAAVRGMASLDPAGVSAQLKNGAFTVSPEDRQTLINYADQMDRAQKAEARAAEAEARQQRTETSLQSSDQWLRKIDQGQASATAIVNDTGLLPAAKENLITWMHTRAQQIIDRPVRTSPAAFEAVRQRIDLPPGDPNRITDPTEVYKFDNISIADKQRLENRARDQRGEDGQKLHAHVEAFLQGIQPQLDSSTFNSIDSAGRERMYNFRFYAEQKVADYVRANKDPSELLDPKSPQYLGKAIPQFQSASQRKQAEISSTIDAAAARGQNARRANETPEEYLKRSGKQ